MIRFLQILLFPICLLVFSVASAQEKKLPQVLFLGDIVHRSIVDAAAKELEKQVTINHVPRGSEVSDSGTALAQLDELLGKNEWDIIYFNFGIGDLCYKDPSTKEIRIMSKHSGGVRVSTPAQYEKQLDELVKHLKSTKAKIIWGNTTPLVNVNAFSSYHSNLFDVKSELEYNSIAARVMAKHKVPVVDLHSHVMAQFKEEKEHPSYAKYSVEMAKRGKPIHTPLVQALQSALGKP